MTDCPADIAALIGGAPQALTGGRTNRLWRSGDKVAKLYQPEAATPLFPNDPDLEWRALTALWPEGLAPEPLDRASVAGKELLIYRAVDGAVGQADPTDIARLLGRLHELRAVTDGWPVAATGKDVIRDGVTMASTLPPPNAPSMPKALCIIHRDPVPTNIVLGPSGPVLIDWQCPALGDPVEDLAHYLSPAMHVLYGGSPLDGDGVRRFLDAYPDRHTVERYKTDGRAYHWRMACYCTWQIQNGSTDYAEPLEAELAGLAARA